MRSVIISADDAGQRLDKYLIKYLDRAPRSFIFKSLRKKNISLNGRKSDGGDLLKEGDEIRLFFSDETFNTLRSGGEDPCGKVKQTGLLSDYCDIIYEDPQIIIADKHAGVLSQKAFPADISVNEALLQYVNEQNAYTGQSVPDAFTPSVCNRLDRNTSGLICFARTYGAAREWNRLFRERDLKKYYLAFVSGTVEMPGRAEAWLLKDRKTNHVKVLDFEADGSSRIETAWEPVDPKALAAMGAVRAADTSLRIPAGYSLLRVELITGKSHQIRAHFKYLGYPLAGDPKYADPGETDFLRNTRGIHRQLLHAYELIMPEKLNAPLGYLQNKRFTAPLPGDFLSFFTGLI